jgi:hypothetical protein
MRPRPPKAVESKKKVEFREKFTLEQTTKVQMGNRSIALLFI